MIKLIASDIDGTLINDQKEFAPDFFEILKALKNRGVKFVAASGRSQYSIAKIFEPCENDICYISDNGAYVVENNIEYALHKLKQADVDSVMELLLQLERIQIILCGKTTSYFVNFKPEFLEAVTEYYTTYEIVEDYKTIKDDFLKIAVFDPKGSADNSYPYICNQLPEKLYAVVSSHEWLDVMDKNINKGVGLEALQKEFNISEDETMVFGDFYNDIEMLKKAKYSFVMENSCDDMKQHGNYIAKSNNNFGVVQAIKEFVLK